MRKRPEIIIGLGNPGSSYEATYHNVGFLFLDYIKAHSPHTTDWITAGKTYDFSSIENTKLIRPKTFMNKSGDAVLGALTTFHVSPEQIIIAHDDHDLPLGTYKIAEPGTGAAGHNGVQSIIEKIGNTMPRLRIGISKIPEGTPHTKAMDVVLNKISKEDHTTLMAVFQKISEQEFSA